MNNHFNSFQFAALLPSLGPLRLMLADTSSPRGSDATLASVGTLSEGFERFVASPLYLVGYVRWDVRSDRYLLVKRSLQQLSGRTPTGGIGESETCPKPISLYEKAVYQDSSRLGKAIGADYSPARHDHLFI